MAVLLEEGGESRPAVARLVGTDKIMQCLWPVAGSSELLDQTEKLRVDRGRADEIEPLDAALLRLGFGKSGPAPGDRLFHQRQHVPRQGTPRRRDRGVLLGVLGRERQVDIDDEQLARHIEVADPEGFGRSVDPREA
jgi:hypothetical protein